jgi:hypothetical protein
MISEALVSVSECVERSIQCPGQRGSRHLFKRKQIQLFTIKGRPLEIFYPLFFSYSALCTCTARTVLCGSISVNLTYLKKGRNVQISKDSQDGLLRTYPYSALKIIRGVAQTRYGTL